jgi:HAD superfamily hydrolase (TIGR01484 family)
MTDIDGTITSGESVKIGESRFSQRVAAAIRRLEENGIMVGFVSGRNVPDLERYAEELGTHGPLIAENGALAKPAPGGELIDLGFKRQVVDFAIEKLNNLFPGKIENGEWNKTRTIDLIILLHGVTGDEIKKHLDNVELLDSGYVFHLTPRGATKGQTLFRVLNNGGKNHFSPDEVLVMGDAPTDLSLFQCFPLSVQVINPVISAGKQQALGEAARYTSESCCDEGFCEVANFIIELRNSKI